MPRRIDPDKPLFTIGAVADILDIKPRMLRLFEERGLITPSRTEGNRRLYTLKDIDMLSYIQYLTLVKRVNMAGVREIQKLLAWMSDAERNRFMEEIERTIETLPLDQRKVYRGDDENLHSFSE
ncbi:MAG: MerR family transcriptional regulator [Fibrobacterota bacterium]